MSAATESHINISLLDDDVITITTNPPLSTAAMAQMLAPFNLPANGKASVYSLRRFVEAAMNESRSISVVNRTVGIR